MKSFKSLALGLLAAAGVASGSLMAAGSTYYLNDHLATTIGTADAAGEIAALEADAFGSPVAGNAPSRYTGKPYDSDMGAYVFPFRNYRAQEARWMSSDPSGFPRGNNNYIYTRDPLASLDPSGLDIIHINNSSAVGGNGHSAAIIGSGDSWTYNSYGSGSSGSGSSSSSNGENLTQLSFTSQADALTYAANNGYNNALTYTTTPEQDAAAQAAANNWQDTTYNVFTHNCVLMVNDILNSANIAHGNSWIPNTNFNQSVRLGNGTQSHLE